MNINQWQPPQKPGEITEARLINAILDGTFPVNSSLPGERELADLLGVTRPTLREAMQRMERDGWLEIRHGKATRVRDFWTEGNFGVSIALAQHMQPLPTNYACNLLEVRVLLCPAYTQKAVEKDAQTIAGFLSQADSMEDTPQTYADFDWELHWLLTVSSGNPFFTHFINSVRGLYEMLGVLYFSHKKTRAHSKSFYRELKKAAEDRDANAASELSLRVMRESLVLWEEISDIE